MLHISPILLTAAEGAALTTSMIVNLIIGIAVGVISYFLKRAITSVDAKADKDDLDRAHRASLEEIDRIKKDIALRVTREEQTELKNKVAELSDDIKSIKQDYITKQDFIREFARLEKQIDQNQNRTIEILLAIKGGMDGR